MCYAQLPVEEIDRIKQQQQDLLKQEQLNREQALESLEPLTPPDTATENDAATKGTEGDAEAPCIRFERIEIKGATLLPDIDQQRLLEPYQNQCLSVVKMKQLQADLTNHYIRAGFITTRVYFPKQSFTDGVLKLWVLEGRYESIEILERPRSEEAETPSTSADESQPRGGFNTVLYRPKHAVLNLRDLEQAIDQINRLKRYDAKMLLEPGETEGTSKVKLYSVTRKPWSLSTGLANKGSKTLGKYQSTYGTRFEDILGLYELWAFSYARELNANRYDRYGRSYSAYVSVPYQYWTFNFSSSLYEYKTPITGKTLTYSTSGNSRNHQLAIARVIHRDQLGKTQVSGKLKHSETRNYVEETFVGVSSRKASAWSMGLEHSRRWQGGVLSGSVTFERGLPWWDAKKRINHDETTPDPLYSLWTSNLSFYKPFALGQQRFAWNTSVYGLWSHDTLYNSERISIGGQYAVRGFESGDLQGDRGFVWRNELHYSLPTISLVTLNHKIVAAYDLGGVIKDWREANERGTLQGMALGYQLYHKHLTTQLQWEYGLTGTSKVTPKHHHFRLMTSLNF